MKIYYDTEFIEDGRTIDLISIGMVAEDGREYYAVSSEFDQKKFRKNDWLMENVLPGLPQLHGDERMIYPKILVDRSHPAAKKRRQIAHEVRDFILAQPNPQLWAWYSAYDHVALCQLWGRMIDLPKGVPMWTNDLKQECVRLGDPKMPGLYGREHNALDDARHVKTMDYGVGPQVASVQRSGSRAAEHHVPCSTLRWHQGGHLAPFVGEFKLRRGPLAHRLPVGQEDVRQELLLQRDDPGFDGLQLGLDDECQGAPALPHGLLILAFPRLRGPLITPGWGQPEVVLVGVGKRQMEQHPPVGDLERDVRTVGLPAIGEAGGTVPLESALDLKAALLAAHLGPRGVRAHVGSLSPAGDATSAPVPDRLNVDVVLAHPQAVRIHGVGALRQREPLEATPSDESVRSPPKRRTGATCRYSPMGHIRTCGRRTPHLADAAPGDLEGRRGELEPRRARLSPRRRHRGSVHPGRATQATTRGAHSGCVAIQSA